MRFSHHHFFVCFLYCPNFCLLVLYRESHVPIGQAGFGNAFLRLLNSVRLCCLFHNLLYQFVLVQRVKVLAPLVVLLLIQLSQTHDLFAFLKFLLELVLDELDLLLLLLFIVRRCRELNSNRKRKRTNEGDKPDLSFWGLKMRTRR